jgi:hypothetical protein
MGRQAVVVLYVLTLIAVVVCVDVLFLKHDIWVRLIVNVGIVLVFAAFYMRFLKGSSSGPPPQAELPRHGGLIINRIRRHRHSGGPFFCPAPFNQRSPVRCWASSLAARL